MCHYIHMPNDKKSLRPLLQAISTCLRIPVFPDYATDWHYDEKIAQHYLLEMLGLPRAKSWVFWNEEEALAFARSASYPIVSKLSVGAGSTGVFLCRNEGEACDQIRVLFRRGVFPYLERGKLAHRIGDSLQMAWDGIVGRTPRLPWYYMPEKSYAYFQEFLPNNDHDIRMIVIGDKCWGLTRNNRPGDFRASGSGLVDFSPDRIPESAIDLAFSYSRATGSQCTALDMLIRADGDPVIIEVSFSFTASWSGKMLGFWSPDHCWHEQGPSFEACQVELLLDEVARSSKPCMSGS